MSNHIESLSEFFQKFDASLDPRLWVSLVKEETAEFKEAHEIFLEDPTPENKAELLKEAADIIYTATGLAILLETGDNLYRFLIGHEEAADWDLTILEGNQQLRIAQGIFGPVVMNEAFQRVHQSNLSKLGDDGKPLRRKDGKVLKGPNYKAPGLMDLVET